MRKKLRFALIGAICVALTLSMSILLAGCTNADLSLRFDRDYGLYWYNDNGEKMLSEADMPAEYYDPAKPTVVYAHGWKADKSPEAFKTLPEIVSGSNGKSGDYDYVAVLREHGYNVATFDWNLYAVDLNKLQDEIYTVQNYDELDEDVKDSVYAEAVKKLNGRTFAGEFARDIATVMAESTNPNLHFIGHSYGGEMVIAAAYTLHKMYDKNIIDNKNLVPMRISLADPYIPADVMNGKMDIIGEKLEKVRVAEMAANAIEYMNDNGAFIDLYGGIEQIFGMYKLLMGDRAKAVTAKLEANAAFVRLKGLYDTYGIGLMHSVARDYVLINLMESLSGKISPALPFNVAVNAEDGREFVGKYYEQQSPDFDIFNDTYQLKK